MFTKSFSDNKHCQKNIFQTRHGIGIGLNMLNSSHVKVTAFVMFKVKAKKAFAHSVRTQKCPYISWGQHSCATYLCTEEEM